MTNTKTPVKNYKKVLEGAELLYSSVEVNRTIDDIAEAITKELSETDPILMPVMIGGLILAGQLIPKLNFPLQIDYIHATRYTGNTKGSNLKWLKKPDKCLANKTILLIDDILDEGITISEIIKYCYASDAKRVLTAVLVEKILDNEKPIQNIDFVGLKVPNLYVFGYGMDYREYHRNASGIYAVKKL